MIKIKGIKHDAVGIINDRVMFRRLEKGKGWEYKNPSFKINFDPDDGYYIFIPINESGECREKVCIKDVIKEISLFKEMYEYYWED